VATELDTGRPDASTPPGIHGAPRDAEVGGKLGRAQESILGGLHPHAFSQYRHILEGII